MQSIMVCLCKLTGQVVPVHLSYRAATAAGSRPGNEANNTTGWEKCGLAHFIQTLRLQF